MSIVRDDDNKNKIFQTFHAELEDKGRNKKMYRLAKVRDLDQVKSIKDEKGNILVDKGLITRR